MARNIDPEILKLIDDPDWLREQHVTQCMSISELSSSLKVTPGAIRQRLRKFNIESPSQQQLREASNIRKYGVTNTGALPSVRQKANDTMTEKFGGHVWSKNGKREERDATCERLYGDANVAKTQHSIKKAKETNNIKYGRDHINQSHIPQDVIDRLRDCEWMIDQHVTQKKPLTLIADELNVDMSTVMRHLHSHGQETKHFFRSVGESQITTMIQSLGISVETNVRNIIDGELDIWIPSHNIAIEYCGLYWHSDTFKERMYHYNKFKMCQNKGIRLLTIFEDEWIHKRQIVESKIINILGFGSERIYARQTQVRVVDIDTKREFLNANHIQGTGPGSITYGLYNKKDIVAVMTFINKGNGIYELNRYATSATVIGGFSKLLCHFKRNHEWVKLISFADLRWSVGDLYIKTGWTCVDVLPPDYYWCKNSHRYHKFNFRHSTMAKKLDKYDPNKSEDENCKNNHYTKLYNCGLMKFEVINE